MAFSHLLPDLSSSCNGRGFPPQSNTHKNGTVALLLFAVSYCEPKPRHSGYYEIYPEYLPIYTIIMAS
jgi:hypothetical protein